MYIACVQTPPPLSKNGRMGPFSDFYWEEVGGGGELGWGLYTG